MDLLPDMSDDWCPEDAWDCKFRWQVVLSGDSFSRNPGSFERAEYVMEHQNTPENFESQALTEHLRELRSCLIISFIAVFVGFCLSYAFIRPIGSWFFKPLIDVLPEGTSLIFTSYQEGFFFT